jgi:hypothetical protein
MATDRPKIMTKQKAKAPGNNSPLLALIVVRLYEEHGGKGRLM